MTQNDMPPNQFNAQDVQALEGIVTQYVDGEVARNDAIAALTKGVVSACTGSFIPFDGDLLLPYLEQLDAHDLQQRAGDGNGGGSGPQNGGGSGDDLGDGDGDHDGDGADRPSGGQRIPLLDRLSGPDRDEDAYRTKRSRVDASSFVWRSHANEFLNSIALSPEHQRVLHQIEIHSVDKSCKSARMEFCNFALFHWCPRTLREAIMSSE
ncbi:hypothetical protein C8R43DRAFT_1123337 [Mycena crocata]|nr:hypothetical protein C8R43DRAFT_1123337 [Mycena crocata]